jgi:hypothetical protein
MASPPASVTCTQCGTIAAEPGLDWMLDADPRRGQVWVCGRCTRENLRSIEAKLDQEWW